MRLFPFFSACSLIAIAACQHTNGNGAEAEAESTTPTPEQTEEAKKQEALQRVSEGLKKVEAKLQEEAARWTPSMRAQANSLATRSYPSTQEALKTVLAGGHRRPGFADRDAYRHPMETLTFFGLEPTMTVVEAGAGSGWYTEILAPVLQQRGQLIAAAYDPNGPKDSFRRVYGRRLQGVMQNAPEIFAKVKPVYVNTMEPMRFGPPSSADLVIAIREMHGWHRRDALKKYVAAIHQVLKPGGVFGVVQHRAPEGANPDESVNQGYLPQQWVVDQVQSMGFKLIASSEINANPKDTKDYEKGVWTLPPNYADGDDTKAKYDAIGESDRMTLKFVKATAAGTSQTG